MRLLKLAQRQCNLLTWHQALSCGLSPDQIRHRVRTGRLVRVHRAVYGLPGVASSPEAAALAACLAAGDRAVASHQTAAALWGVLEPGVPTHVTVPYARRPTVGDTVTVHRTTVLRRVDVTRLGVVPTTTPMRTLLDVAAHGDDAEVERCLDNSLLRGIVSCPRLRSFLGDKSIRHLPGAPRLRALADNRLEGVPATELERALDRLYRDYRLPAGVKQLDHVAAGRPVCFDRAHLDERVGVEVDGRATHTGRLDWQADLERNNATGLDGWLVLRFTWWHVREQPGYVAFTISRALGLLPSGWRKPRSRSATSPVRAPRPSRTRRRRP